MGATSAGCRPRGPGRQRAERPGPGVRPAGWSGPARRPTLPALAPRAPGPGPQGPGARPSGNRAAEEAACARLRGHERAICPGAENCSVRGARRGAPGSPAGSPVPRARTDRCCPRPRPVPGPGPDQAREAVQGLADPSPRAPLAPPEAARTPGPGGGEGASSWQCPNGGLGLPARGPHREVRARCQAAAQLGCEGWAPRGGRPAASPSRGHGWAGSAQAGNPSRPGSWSPLTPQGRARGRERHGGEGEGQGWWVRGCGPAGPSPRPVGVAQRRLLAAPGTSRPPPHGRRACGRREPGRHGLGSERQTRAAASILFPAQLGLWWWWCGFGVRPGTGITCGRACSGPEASKTPARAPR